MPRPNVPITEKVASEPPFPALNWFIKILFWAGVVLLALASVAVLLKLFQSGFGDTQDALLGKFQTTTEVIVDNIPRFAGGFLSIVLSESLKVFLSIEKSVRILSQQPGRIHSQPTQKIAHIQSQPTQDEYECESCGTDVAANATSCPKCGADLTETV